MGSATVDTSPNARRGFTLVELLVVITIIGILMSLLLPAVQSARESARKTQCGNNLKQLGLAVLAHESLNKFFPTGGWGWSWVGDPDRGFGLKQPGGWIYNSLPYMDQVSLHNQGMGNTGATKWAAATAMLAQPVSTFNCPSRRRAITYPNLLGNTYHNAQPPPSVVARSDYAANQGDAAVDQVDGGPPDLNTGDTSWSWYNAASNGVTGLSYIRSLVKVAMITDGASNTYYAGERYINPNDYVTGADGADNECALAGWDNDNYRDASGNAVPLQDTPGVANGINFGGPHASGVNFVFCDGSVHNISYSIDAETHRRLANRSDGLPIDASKYQ